jgi:hypothetical protein
MHRCDTSRNSSHVGSNRSLLPWQSIVHQPLLSFRNRSIRIIVIGGEQETPRQRTYKRVSHLLWLKKKWICPTDCPEQ